MIFFMQRVLSISYGFAGVLCEILPAGNNAALSPYVWTARITGRKGSNGPVSFRQQSLKVRGAPAHGYRQAQFCAFDKRRPRSRRCVKKDCASWSAWISSGSAPVRLKTGQQTRLACVAPPSAVAKNAGQPFISSLSNCAIPARRFCRYRSASAIFVFRIALIQIKGALCRRIRGRWAPPGSVLAISC